MSDAKPLVITPGEDYPLVLTFRVKATGEAESQVGAVLQVMVKDAPGKPDAQALTSLTVNASAPDDALGKIRFTLPKADTRNYPNAGSVWIEARRMLAGVTRTVFALRLLTAQSVIRDV